MNTLQMAAHSCINTQSHIRAAMQGARLTHLHQLWATALFSGNELLHIMSTYNIKEIFILMHVIEAVSH